jgi:hypothetical protein
LPRWELGSVFCGQCGAEVAERDLFCSACGAATGRRAEPEAIDQRSTEQATPGANTAADVVTSSAGTVPTSRADQRGQPTPVVDPSTAIRAPGPPPVTERAPAAEPGQEAEPTTASQPYPGSAGPLGKPRGIGFAILLFIVTVGIYGLYWVYKTQEEMKQHTGEGIGGVLGLVVWILLTPVSAFVIASEVGNMYAKAGRSP